MIHMNKNFLLLLKKIDSKLIQFKYNMMDFIVFTVLKLKLKSSV